MENTAAATSALATAGASEIARLVAPLPLLKRVQYSLIIFLYSNLLNKPTLFFTAARKYLLPPPKKDADPDLVKTYPVRKSLETRIFFPPSYSPSTSSPQTTKLPTLPTLLTIHGGGFTVGSPLDNDAWNRAFSTRHNFLVIALDYTKAPAGPFPTAVHDIEALIGCILADASLPLDTSRVALAGWSAGGNLTLAASQLPSLRGRIHAAVPLYPLVDIAPDKQVKAKGRRYKPSLGGFRGRDQDYLLMMMGLFNWAYLSPGMDCEDPRLSPIHAPRDTLPRHIFIIACELDLLAPEAWRMACKLAGKKIPGLDEVVGCEETVGKGVLITEGDERFSWEKTMDDGSRYKWLLVPDTIHGFDMDNIGSLTRDPACTEDSRIKTAKVIDMVGQWLLDGPLKADS